VVGGSVAPLVFFRGPPCCPGDCRRIRRRLYSIAGLRDPSLGLDGEEDHGPPGVLGQGLWGCFSDRAGSGSHPQSIRRERSFQALGDGSGAVHALCETGGGLGPRPDPSDGLHDGFPGTFEILQILQFPIFTQLLYRCPGVLSRRPPHGGSFRYSSIGSDHGGLLEGG